LKKFLVLISIISIFILIYLLVVLLPRNYTITYNIDNFKVTESYNRYLNYYTFLIEYENKTFPLIYQGRHIATRQIVTNIEKISYEDSICLSIYIQEALYPVCYIGDELVSFHLTVEEIRNKYQDLIFEFGTNVIDTLDSLRIYNYLDNKYFVWNYRGYYFLSEEQNRNINLLDSDDYNNALALKVNHFLITPNYDRNHTFNELFIINTSNLELSSFVFDEEEIPYNSYFQGVQGQYAYLVDRKNRLQYQINVRRRTIEVIGTTNRPGKWYNNGWEEISLTRLVNEEYIFRSNQVHNFVLNGSNLYYLIGNYQKRVSNQDVKKIIYIDNDRVFYLVENVLYMFSNVTGEVRLISNPEWHFNFQNKIFIFN